MKIYEGDYIRYVNSNGKDHRIGMPYRVSVLGPMYSFCGKEHRLNGKSRIQHWTIRDINRKIVGEGSENKCTVYNKSIDLCIYRLVI